MGKRDIKAESALITVAKQMKKMGMTPRDFIKTYAADDSERQELAQNLFRLGLTTFREYNHPQYDIFWE